MDTKSSTLIDELNDDLALELQSIVQYNLHIALLTGAEYTSIIDELKAHLGQELSHASVLAEQVAFLQGTPSTVVPPVPAFVDSEQALRDDLALEINQLERYRTRVQQANDAGLADVAEALRPLLTQTQEHVRDLQTVLGL